MSWRGERDRERAGEKQLSRRMNVQRIVWPCSGSPSASKSKELKKGFPRLTAALSSGHLLSMESRIQKSGIIEKQNKDGRGQEECIFCRLNEREVMAFSSIDVNVHLWKPL